MESSAAPSVASSAGKKRKPEADPVPLQELAQNSSSSSPSSSSAAPAAESKPAKRQKAKKPKKHKLSKEEIAELLKKGEFFQGGDEDDDEGEEPVYDDCNEVRNKIRAFLRTGRMTQTAFLKTLGINSNSHRHFMSYTGKTQGSNNGLYPAAYRFFESLRILEGRPKSAKRKGAEDIFGEQGRSLERRPQFYLVPRDAIVVEDEWGRVGAMPKTSL